MKSADLPNEVKKKLLEQIERQVGRSQYRNMVDQVGEDGLIDLALGKAEEMAQSQKAQSQSTTKSKGFWSEWGGVIWFVVIVGILPALGGEWLPLKLIVGMIVVVWIYSGIQNWWQRNKPPGF